MAGDVAIGDMWPQVAPLLLIVKTQHASRSAVSIQHSVVKVRGDAGNAVPGPLKIAGQRSQAPHSRQWYEQVERGPFSLQ